MVHFLFILSLSGLKHRQRLVITIMIIIANVVVSPGWPDILRVRLHQLSSLFETGHSDPLVPLLLRQLPPSIRDVYSRSFNQIHGFLIKKKSKPYCSCHIESWRFFHGLPNTHFCYTFWSIHYYLSMTRTIVIVCNCPLFQESHLQGSYSKLW